MIDAGDVATVASLLFWGGVYAPMALAAIGATIGVATAGQAAVGAMVDTEGGHGRFIGIAAMPSSQAIYGIVVTLALQRPVAPAHAGAVLMIGLLCGAALLVNAIQQGACCAAAIQAVRARPEVMGLSLAPAAIVEGFAVFAFVFALVVAGTVPGITAGGP